MRPAVARFLIYWAAIAVTLIGPYEVIMPLVGDDLGWRRFFCHAQWYAQWEVGLLILVPSFLHHQFWLGRTVGNAGKESVAANLIIHGMLIVPLMVVLLIAFQHSSVPGPGTEQLRAMYVGYFVYWLLSAGVIAKLDCLWPTSIGPGGVAVWKRAVLLFSLPGATHVIAFLLFLGDGPCVMLGL